MVKLVCVQTFFFHFDHVNLGVGYIKWNENISSSFPFQFGMKTWTPPPSVCLSVSLCVYVCMRVCVYSVPRVEIRSGINGMSLAACPPSPPSHSSVPNTHSHTRPCVTPLHPALLEHTHAHTVSHTHSPLAVLHSLRTSLTLPGLWTSEQASPIPL